MFKLVVLSSLLAVAVAKPSGIGIGLAGLGLGAPWGAPWGAHVAAPWAAPVAAPWAAPVAAPILAAPIAHAPAVGVAGPTVVAAPLGGAAHNYRGPVSLAPGQPASILAADGRPLDTLSVNADRAVHLNARAVDAATAHGHLIGKRSAPLLGVGAWAHGAPLGLPAAPLAISAAHGWRAPIAPLGLGPLGHAGILGPHW